VVASHDQDVFPVIRKLFTNTRLVLKEEPDIKHTCYCSVLKNVYALLVGMNDGYGCGDNARGMLVAKCLQEMDESAKVLAVPRRVITGPAGWGDFFGTALSEHSLNRAVGERLARGETVLHAEGLDSLVGLVKLLVSRGAHPLPLLAFLESAARGTASREQFEILLSM
jgi:glycerol-3-phosphate dehydrogenase (NAD(P)+)